MPTQLDNTWLPGETKEINSDMLGGVSKTHEVSKEVLGILESISSMTYRGMQSIPILKILKDQHSDLTSDDLLWYIQRGLSGNDIILLKHIKIKGESMSIPRELSREIKAESDQAFGGKKNWKLNDNFDEHLRLKPDPVSYNLPKYGRAPHF